MIDKELAAFLQEGIAIQLGTRNARLEPNGARVVAVKVEDDGQPSGGVRAEDGARRRCCPISRPTDRRRSCSRGRPTSAPAR